MRNASFVDESVDAHQPRPVIGHALLRPHVRAQNVHRNAVQLQVLLPEADMVRIRLDKMALRVRDLSIEPHGVEAPVGSQLNHHCSVGDVLQNLLEDLLLLRLVHSSVQLQQPGDGIAVVAARADADTVVHDQVRVADLASVPDPGYVLVVRARENIIDPLTPVFPMFAVADQIEAKRCDGSLGERRVVEPAHERSLLEPSRQDMKDRHGHDACAAPSPTRLRIPGAGRSVLEVYRTVLDHPVNRNYTDYGLSRPRASMRSSSVRTDSSTD